METPFSFTPKNKRKATIQWIYSIVPFYNNPFVKQHQQLFNTFQASSVPFHIVQPHLMWYDKIWPTSKFLMHILGGFLLMMLLVNMRSHKITTIHPESLIESVPSAKAHGQISSNCSRNKNTPGIPSSNKLHSVSIEYQFLVPTAAGYAASGYRLVRWSWMTAFQCSQQLKLLQQHKLFKV